MAGEPLIGFKKSGAKRVIAATRKVESQIPRRRAGGMQGGRDRGGSDDGARTPLMTIGSASEGDETAATDTWSLDDDDVKAVDVWQVTRLVYNPTGGKKLYAFVRKFSYDTTGKLYAISGETRYEVDGAVSACA